MVDECDVIDSLNEECSRLARNLDLSQRSLRWCQSGLAILLGMFLLVLAALIHSVVTQ